MMRFWSCLLCVAALLFVCGCHSGEGNGMVEEEGSSIDNSLFALRNFSHSGCKKNISTNRVVAAQNYTPGKEEYIEYEGRESNYINISHLNSMFNCGVREVGVEIAVSNDTIHLSEKMTEGRIMRCGYCPFDVMVDAGPLADGVYTLIVAKEGQDYGKASIAFSPTAKGKVLLEPLE